MWIDIKRIVSRSTKIKNNHKELALTSLRVECRDLLRMFFWKFIAHQTTDDTMKLIYLNYSPDGRLIRYSLLWRCVNLVSQLV